MLKIPFPSPPRLGWLCGKEGGRRGFPAQERLPFLSWGFTGTRETKGAGRTSGKVPPHLPGVGHPRDTGRGQLQEGLKGQSWCWVGAPGMRL